MRVTLINPPSPFLIDQKAFPPLGILYIAAYLRENGIEVKVIDLANQENHLEDALAKVKGDFIGLSATTPQYPYARGIKDIIKQQNSGIPVIVGGAHPSSAPERCLNDGFDIVIAGEGEGALLKAVKENLSEKLIKTPYINDIDRVSFPARDIIDLRSYGYDIEGGKATTIITSRGCPFKCAFCSKDVWQGKVRFHSVDYVFSELKQIISKFGIKYFLFLDDSFTLSKRRLIDLCQRIAPLKIKWRCYASTRTTDSEMLKTMKEAGCIEVGVGIESGSQKILDIVNKGITVEQNTEFVLSCKKIGLSINAFIMIGLPGETYETVEATKRWMEKVRPDKFGFNIFMPYVGTPVWRNLENYDLTISDIPEEHSWVKGSRGKYHCYVSTKELSSGEILRLFNELFEYYTQLLNWRPGIGRPNLTLRNR